MTSEVIFAAHDWPTNAALIESCHKLGYLRDTDHILDPTYGRGTWWHVWKPARLSGRTLDTYWEFYEDEKYEYGPRRWDFRDMSCYEPSEDESYDAVAFDPPYVCPGGRTTTSIPGMHDAYGMGDTPLTPEAVQRDINAGLNECYRVVKRGGIVLVKCQSYISSGKLFPGLFLTQAHAQVCGFQLVDHLVHVAGPRPQPHREGQKHARRNQSDLLVLRRPKRDAG